jgi:hypothetical protein
MTLELPTWGAGHSNLPKPLARPDAPPSTPRGKQAAPKPAATEEIETDFSSVMDGLKPIEVPDEIVVLSSTANLCDRDFIQLTSAALLAQLPKEQRVLRTTFVNEYLYDFDPLLAAIRTGFLNVRAPNERFSPAMNAARSLMAEPVVQRLIKECMLSVVQDEKLEAVALTLTLREATNHGISGNAAARNGAFKMLLDAVAKAKDTSRAGEAIKGNVMLVPSTSASEDAWEKAAMESQRKLKESVRA